MKQQTGNFHTIKIKALSALPCSEQLNSRHLASIFYADCAEPEKSELIALRALAPKKKAVETLNANAGCRGKRKAKLYKFNFCNR